MFRRLKLYNNICALSGFALFCGLLCTPVAAFAQDDDEILFVDDDDTGDENGAQTLVLDAVDVMDSVEQDVRNGARPAFAQTVVKPHVQSVNDWLESANGVYGDSSGKGTRSLIVRGFETRQLDFQFNGMPLDAGYDGMTVLDVMPMNWISAGRIAHADATPTDGVGMGGKIDLYALDPSLLEAALEITPTGVTGALSHGMHLGAWRWAVTAGGMFSSGFRLSNAFKPTPEEDGGLRDFSHKRGGNFLVKAGRTLGNWGDFELTAGWAQAPRGVPTGVNTGNLRFWEYTSWREAFAMAKFSWHADYWTGLVQIWANDQGNTLEAYDDESRKTQETSMSSTSVWRDDDYGMRLDLSSMPIDAGSAGYFRALLRADMRYQIHHSNETLYGSNSQSEKQASRLYYQVIPAVEWQITPDVRIFASGSAIGAKAVSQSDSKESNRSARLEDVHSGGMNIGLDYAILPTLDLNLRAARRLRLPTLKEQFRNIPEMEGLDIPQLKPEVAWDFEAEVHWKPLDEIALTIGIFDTEIRDLIEFKYYNAQKIAFNVAESRIAGTDIALKLGAWAGVSFDLSYHYLYAYDLSQNHVLNDRPAHNLRASVTYEPIDRLRLTVGGQFESKRRTEAWLTTKSAWMGNVFLLNAEVEYQLEHFSMYLRGTNLTDYNYSRAFGYPEAGINVTLGAKMVY